MKILLSSKTSLFLPMLIFIIALSFRSLNFSKTITYASDQGEFLLDSAEILTKKPVKLIGIYVSSKKVEDKYFFTGSQFSYFLAFWQAVLGHDPGKITYVFAIINSLSVMLTFLVGRKLFGTLIGFGSAFFYATFPFAINYSKTIWNPGLQPFLTILIIFLMLKLNQKMIWQMAIAGFLLGTQTAIEYSSVLLIPLILTFIYFLNRERFKKDWIVQVFVFGAAFALGIGNLILFDIRHDLYNLRLLVKYYLTTGGQVQFSLHHLLPFLPLLILTAFYLLQKIIRNKKSCWFFMCLAVATNIFFYLSRVNRQTQGFGMPPYWSYPDMVKAAEIIKNDLPLNFNIAQTIDGDSRSFSMRYLLMYQMALEQELNSTIQYNSSDLLYVLHYNDQDVTNGGPYELTSFSWTREVIWTKPVNSYISLSKLKRG